MTKTWVREGETWMWREHDSSLVTKSGREMTEVEITLLSDIEAARHDLDEARFEIERHHRDFARISATVENALQGCLPEAPASVYSNALREIRGIVG
jgi:hypothetical protein